MSTAHDIPKTNKPRIHYVVFLDELAGDYGYWLAESAEELRRGLEGEKYIDDIRYGSFPTEKANLAKAILDTLTVGDEPDFYSSETLDSKLGKIGEL